jgi:hypothetical protein
MSIRHVLAIEQIVAELTGRGVAVLIVSALGSPRHVRRMLHAGVAGVVAKSDSIDDLRVRRVGRPEMDESRTGPGAGDRSGFYGAIRTARPETVRTACTA